MSQQTSSTQLPDMQSSGSVHGAPLSAGVLVAVEVAVGSVGHRRGGRGGGRHWHSFSTAIRMKADRSAESRRAVLEGGEDRSVRWQEAHRQFQDPNFSRQVGPMQFDVRRGGSNFGLTKDGQQPPIGGNGPAVRVVDPGAGVTRTPAADQP